MLGKSKAHSGKKKTFTETLVGYCEDMTKLQTWETSHMEAYVAKTFLLYFVILWKHC